MQPENLLKRDFTADEPNKKWLTDITQVNCKDGKLYIVPVFDCFSGEIVSLAMDRNIKKHTSFLKMCFNSTYFVKKISFVKVSMSVQHNFLPPIHCQINKAPCYQK